MNDDIPHDARRGIAGALSVAMFKNAAQPLVPNEQAMDRIVRDRPRVEVVVIGSENPERSAIERLEACLARRDDKRPHHMRGAHWDDHMRVRHGGRKRRSDLL